MPHGSFNKIRILLGAEQERLILWVPVMLGLGIGWYFHRTREPPFWLGPALFLLFAFGAWATRRRYALYLACLALALMGAGVMLAALRTRMVQSPVLSVSMTVAEVTGRVMEIAPTPKGSKLLLDEVTIAGLKRQETPHRVSISLRSYDANLLTGDHIALRAGLFPPPGPALPGGFDFSRYFYFRGIGAVGYGLPPVRLVKTVEETGWDVRFAEFRHRLTQAIRSHFREPAGAVSAAFITGETRAIPDAVNDDMRTAGLYHLLAVSGMNLSVVAGLAFFSLRFLLASFPYVALRHPIKKWAALLALLASYAYLRVSGSPVSAERAFFMVSLIFLSILLDREPMPMRSLALAAFCILLYEPEAALTASFQLSFSATAALVASYEWGTAWFSSRNTPTGWGVARLGFYFATVMGTALVAWLGTEPFIVYHFNQFSSYSLLANTLAEPLVSFLLMPLVIAGVLLLPFGLSELAFYPLQYGVDILLRLARFTASLPHAMTLVPSPTDAGFCLVILSAIWVYFWKTRLRWLGLALACIGFSTCFLYRPPDLLVSGDAKLVAVRLNPGRIVLLKGRLSNLTAQQWLRAELADSFTDKDAADLHCDKSGCAFYTARHTIALPETPDNAREDCRLVDIVIAPFPLAAEDCPAFFRLDKPALEANGATALWWNGADIRIDTAQAHQGARPWTH